MSTAKPPDAGLVPLHDRLRYMLVFRTTVAVVVSLAWSILPAARGLSLLALVSRAPAIPPRPLPRPHGPLETDHRGTGLR